LTLSGTNSYTGNTTVNGGNLILQNSSLYTNSTVIITNGAGLRLAFTGTNTVAGLVLNGVSQPAGVYGSSTTGGFLAGSTGSLMVAAAANAQPLLAFSNIGGGSLQLSWTNYYDSVADMQYDYILQWQTNNSTSQGLGTNWLDYPNGDISPVNVMMNTTAGSVFFRLRLP